MNKQSKPAAGAKRSKSVAKSQSTSTTARVTRSTSVSRETSIFDVSRTDLDLANPGLLDSSFSSSTETLSSTVEVTRTSVNALVYNDPPPPRSPGAVTTRVAIKPLVLDDSPPRFTTANPRSDKMTYTPWDFSREVLAAQRFCPYVTLMDFVTQHRFLQFNVKANRDRIRSDYMAIPCSAPFNQSVRFPEAIYVHLDHPAIDGWLTQMLQALDLPDRQIEKGNGSSDSADAKRSANVAFNELHKLLINTEQLVSNGIYNRASFETKYGLTWA